jgi:hypothetical protein
MNQDITAITQENYSMSLAVGSSSGIVKIFDLRYLNKPVLEVQHQY